MIIKLVDLRNEFYEYSKKTSEIFRQLSLAGIALVWIFKKDTSSATEYLTHLPPDLIRGIEYFIAALAVDFFHAFIPSIILGIRAECEDLKKTKDENELDLSFKWAIPTWFFYIGKVILMMLGYYTLYCSVFQP